MMDVMLGTAAQIRYARNIYAGFLQQVDGRADLLPDVSLAAFWIEHRNATPRELWAAASDTAGQLLYSPFTSVYPRWGHSEAVATLRLLDTFKVVDCETDGLGKAAQLLDVAVVDQDGAVLLSTLVRPPDLSQLDSADGKRARDTNGITAAMVANAPTLPDVWPRLVDVLTEPETGMLTAFNLDFDARILRNAAACVGIQVPALTGLCGMKLATAFYNRDFYLSLDEVGALTGIKRTIEETAHRALGDACYTARLIWHLHTRVQERSTP